MDRYRCISISIYIYIYHILNAFISLSLLYRRQWKSTSCQPKGFYFSLCQKWLFAELCPWKRIGHSSDPICAHFPTFRSRIPYKTISVLHFGKSKDVLVVDTILLGRRKQCDSIILMFVCYRFISYKYNENGCSPARERGSAMTLCGIGGDQKASR